MVNQQGRIKKRQEFENPAIELDSEPNLGAAKNYSQYKRTDSHWQVKTENDAVDNALSEQETLAIEKSLVPKPWSKLTKLMLSALLALVVVETSSELISIWRESYYLFAFYALVLFLVICWGGRFTYKERKKLKKLKSTARLQTQGQRLRQSMQQGEASIFIDNVFNGLQKNTSIQNGFNQFQQQTNQMHNDAELVSLFDDMVLSVCDKQALKIVNRYSAESALLLAVSPLAVLDMALILWRNQKMLQDIAAVYGIELGYISRLKLIRSIIHNIIYAGATEVAMDLGNQLISMEVTGKLSARLAQGMGAGLLTTRLGYQAIGLCRPLEFEKQNKPKLTAAYKSLFSELSSFFKKRASTQ